MNTRAPRKAWLANAGALVLSLAVALVLAELVLRVPPVARLVAGPGAPQYREIIGANHQELFVQHDSITVRGGREACPGCMRRT